MALILKHSPFTSWKTVVVFLSLSVRFCYFMKALISAHRCSSKGNSLVFLLLVCELIK